VVARRLNRKIVDTLKKSQEQAGELQGVVVCLQHPKVVLSGYHRSEARGGVEKVQEKVPIDVDRFAKRHGIPHELAERSLVVHGNIHRRVEKEETREEVLGIAKGLEASVPRDKIASKLAEILPFSRSYMLRLLPDEYKQKEFARSSGSRKKASFSGVDDLGHQDHRSAAGAAPANEGIEEVLRWEQARVQCQNCKKYVPRESTVLICERCASKILKSKLQSKVASGSVR